MIESWIGPEHLTNIKSLSRRNVRVRQWWSGERFEKGEDNQEGRLLGSIESDRAHPATAPKLVMALFGQDDPLLPEFRQILVDTIKVSKLVLWFRGRLDH